MTKDKKNFLRVIFALFFIFSTCNFSFCEPEIALIVNGDKIYKDDFDYALSKYEDSYKSYFGDNLDEETHNKMKKELVKDLIIKQLYIQEARRRGITAKVFAGEEEIEEILMKNPIFYTDGKFDETKYERFNIEASSDAKSIRDRAEELIIADKMREILPPKVINAMKEDVSTNDKEVLDEYSNRSEKMKIRYIKVDPVVFANNMDVREDDIKSYYSQNKENFRRPQMREYAVLFFDPDDYTNMVSVTEQMLKDYYTEHIDDYKTEKFVKVKYVLFRVKEYTNSIYETRVNERQYYEANIDKYIEPAEAHIRFISIKKPCSFDKLKAFIGDLGSDMSFADVARKYSDDPSTAENGGDLGYIKRGTLKDPFDGIAFNLKPGEISQVIETQKGYCVIAVEDKKNERLKPFDEVHDEIDEELLCEDAKPIALADARRFMIEAKRIGFEAAADNKKKTMYETDYFGEYDKVPVIGRNALFTSSALNTPSGEVGDVISYDGGYLVFKLHDIKPQNYLSFSDASKEVERKIMNEDSAIYAESAAKRALTLLNEKVSLDEVKNRMSVHVSMIETSSNEVPADLGKIVKKNDGYYVTILNKELPSYIQSYITVSAEATSLCALERADKKAQEKANQIVLSGEISREGTIQVGPFSKNDYVIDGEYLKPFIEECFSLKAGEIKLIKSMGKYFIVQVLERGIQLSDYTDESLMLKSQVLKEKRSGYIEKWLKDEKDRAEIQINI